MILQLWPQLGVSRWDEMWGPCEGWGQSSAVSCWDGFNKMTKQCRCTMVRAGLLWEAYPCPLQGRGGISPQQRG